MLHHFSSLSHDTYRFLTPAHSDRSLSIDTRVICVRGTRRLANRDHDGAACFSRHYTRPRSSCLTGPEVVQAGCQRCPSTVSVAKNSHVIASLNRNREKLRRSLPSPEPVVDFRSGRVLTLGR